MSTPVVTPVDAAISNRWEHPAKMPERFGVGLMLFFLSLFSVAFCILRACDVSPATTLFLTLLLTAVGFGQILKPDQPRRASTLAGAIFFPIWLVAVIGFEASRLGREMRFLAYGPLFLMAAIPGGCLGYLAGTLLAGIFLRAGITQEDAHAAVAGDGLTPDGTGGSAA